MAKKLHWDNKASNKTAVKELIKSIQTTQTSYHILKKSLSGSHVTNSSVLFLSRIQASQKSIKRVFENFPPFLFSVLTSYKWSVLLWNVTNCYQVLIFFPAWENDKALATWTKS